MKSPMLFRLSHCRSGEPDLACLSRRKILQVADKAKRTLSADEAKQLVEQLKS